MMQKGVRKSFLRLIMCTNKHSTKRRGLGVTRILELGEDGSEYFELKKCFNACAKDSDIQIPDRQIPGINTP